MILPADDHIYVVKGFNKTLNPSINSSTVKQILERYAVSQEITTVVDPSGKPRIKTADGSEIFISLSHADDILVVALSAHGDLGIDIEKQRSRKFAHKIAERYFDTQPKTIEDFYRAWTAREAFIKAIGSRISATLAHIHTAQCGQELLIGTSNDYTHVVRFFTPQENYIAALCRLKNAGGDVKLFF